MLHLKKLNIALMAVASVVGSAAFAAPGLTALTDEQLSETTGQALMSLSYLAPNAANNLESQRTDGDKTIGFYKLGMEAELELNANIKKLQLGCGGMNGGGQCDIDIDNLSLSGISDTRDGRAGSSAKITNPFLEFAVKSPESAAKREIVGLRFSAEKVLGLLTAGTENSSVQNGINTISGFMRIQSDSSGYVYGRANTGERFLEAKDGARYIVDGKEVYYNNGMTGKVDTLATLSIKTNGGGMNIPAMSNIPFIRPGVTVNGNRIGSLPLQATLAIPKIQAGLRGEFAANGSVITGNPNETLYSKDSAAYSPIDWQFSVPTGIQTTGGAMSALITGCEGALCGLTNLFNNVKVGATLQNAFLKGNITNIVGDVTINQGLGYIHYLPIDSTSSSSVPTYLGLQSQALRWPGSYSGANPERLKVNGQVDLTKQETITDIAQAGWWLSVGSPVNLGSVDPTEKIDIAPLFPQIAQVVSKDITDNPLSIDIGSLINAVAGSGDIAVTTSKDISLLGKPLTLQLNDLLLNGQSFAPNCYGSLKFC